MTQPLTSPDAIFRAARPRLLRWFERNARLLPWRPPHPLALPTSADPLLPAKNATASGKVRNTGNEPLRSPYAVWISEVMLQQTQVAVVIPYFERWLARFPHPVALAEAPEEEVLRSWAGLGYYARARNLQKAAEALAEAGTYPATVEEWVSLPGIGEYTAGAVASLAFGLRAPILDGNVVRVFSRLLGLAFLPGDDAASRRAYWDLAATWADHPQAGAVNEGLMELGALVCAPSSPRCGECPLSAVCTAFRENRQQELPPVRKRPKPETVRGVAVRATLAKKVLTERRGPGAFLAGHEMFPLFLGAGAEAWRALFEARFPGLRIRNASPGARVRHSIMSKRYDLEIWDCELSGKPGEESSAAVWSASAALEARLTNALARKVWKAGRGDGSTVR